MHGKYAISKLLHVGGTCKVVFVVTLDTTEAGGWITPGDNATMRLILDAAPELENVSGSLQIFVPRNKSIRFQIRKDLQRQ